MRDKHRQGDDCAVAIGDRVNVIVDNILYDGCGDNWSTKHSRWATPKQAAGFVGRDTQVGLLDAPGKVLTWMSGQSAQEWWAHAKHHFEVPGTSHAEPDDTNRTWGAHLWQRGDARLLVFETFC